MIAKPGNNWFVVKRDKEEDEKIGEVKSRGEIVDLDAGGSRKIRPKVQA